MSQTDPSRLTAWLRVEFGSGNWIPGLTTGALIGIVELFFALSLASLIFAGDLAPYRSHGLWIALVTPIIVLIVISLGSSVSGVTGTLQDTSGVMLAALAAALFGSLGAADAEEKLATVLVGIAVATLLTGLFLWAMGFFRLGSLVRYVPYPVVGGFLAGTGWLLLAGSFSVMADVPPTLSGLQAALDPGQLYLWVPGALLAVILLVALRWVRHVLTMPAILVAAFVLFYLILHIVGLSLDEAAAFGLLLVAPPPVPGAAAAAAGEVIWQPLVPQLLVVANWSAILGQAGNVAIVLILTIVSLLLNASGIELAIRRDLDLNRELRIAGAANLLSGLAGGVVGFHALSLSTLGPRMGARGRMPSLVAALLLAAVALGGAPLLALAPRPVVGGLLLFLGLDFLLEWVVAGRSRLSRVDYAIVLLILVVIATTNFLVGVGVGLVTTLLLFVVSYSRISVIHHALSGTEMLSNVERSADQRRRLWELGAQIYILELRGFIFFGTADRLLQQIRSRVAAADLPRVRFVVLDFRRVTGLDSSAILSFRRGMQLTQAREITLVLTHLTTGMRRQFEIGGPFASDLRFFPDLDRGLEWCEETLLEHAEVSLEEVPLTLVAQLAEGGLDAAHGARLMTYLVKVEAAEGEYLVRQGGEEGDLYLIERGKVSVYRECRDGSRLRLRTLGRGTAIGELGLYLKTGRTASVIADSPTTAYRLAPSDLARMKDEEPVLAAAFHEMIARMLAERLVSKDRSIEAMLR